MWFSLWEVTTIGKQNIYGLIKMKTYLSYLIEDMHKAAKYCMCKDFENDTHSDVDNFEPDLCTDNSHEIAILDQELNEIAENQLPGAPIVNKLEKYVTQLIEDLNFAVEKRINQPNIPDNIEIRSVNSLIDLINKPNVYNRYTF